MLSTEIAEGRSILYLDESSFNSQMKQSQAWFIRDTTFVIPAS